MPELPEVETVVRGLRPHLVGRVLGGLVQRRPDLRTRLPRNFAARVEGRRVLSVDRRAKYVLIHLDDGNVLVIHLGMSGRLVIGPRPNTPPGKHDHVEFATDRGMVVRFSDPRRFGMMDLMAEAALATDKRFRDLGPEPLSADFNADYLLRRLKGSRTSAKAALLDQRVVAGLGNIYVCEALFDAGISPRRRAGSINRDRAERHLPPPGPRGPDPWRGACRRCRSLLAVGRTGVNRLIPGGQPGYLLTPCSKYWNNHQP